MEIDTDERSGGSAWPTWRFYLLALIALPGVIGLFIIDVSRMDWDFFSGQSSSGLVIATAVLLTYVLTCTFLVFFWRAPAHCRRMPNALSRDTLIQVGIWILALIATPSAFFSTCYPAGFLSSVAVYDAYQGNESAGTGILCCIALGIILGLVCIAFTLRLAYHLWLDAVGKRIKPIGAEEVDRPVLHLKARTRLRND
jgi:uncharacterized YccA/Bax inhibitor family protein